MATLQPYRIGTAVFVCPNGCFADVPLICVKVRFNTIWPGMTGGIESVPDTERTAIADNSPGRAAFSYCLLRAFWVRRRSPSFTGSKWTNYVRLPKIKYLFFRGAAGKGPERSTWRTSNRRRPGVYTSGTFARAVARIDARWKSNSFRKFTFRFIGRVMSRIITVFND